MCGMSFFVFVIESDDKSSRSATLTLVESKQFAWMVVFVFEGFDLEGNTNTKISQGKITNQNLLKKKERVASLLYNH